MPTPPLMPPAQPLVLQRVQVVKVGGGLSGRPPSLRRPSDPNPIVKIQMRPPLASLDPNLPRLSGRRRPRSPPPPRRTRTEFRGKNSGCQKQHRRRRRPEYSTSSTKDQGGSKRRAPRAHRASRVLEEGGGGGERMRTKEEQNRKDFEKRARVLARKCVENRLLSKMAF